MGETIFTYDLCDLWRGPKLEWGEMFAKYVRWLLEVKNVSEHTIKTKRCHLATFERFVNKAMDKVTNEDVSFYIISLRQRGLQEISIHSYLITLGAFFTWALEITENDRRVYPTIKENPTLKAKKDFPTLKIEYVPVDAPKRLRNQLLTVCTYARDGLLVEFLTRTGMRSGEASSAMYNDIEFHQVNEKNTPCLRVVGKGERIRWLTLHDKLFAMFMAGQNGNPYLIPSVRRKGQGMVPASIGKRIKILADKADLNITAHTLRAAVITEVCRTKGVAVAQIVAGHQSIITTQRYLRFNINDVAEALEAVS